MFLFSCQIILNGQCRPMNISYSHKQKLERALSNRALWLTVLESGAVAVIMLVAVLGNCLVCWAVCKNKRLRTTANYYVISLATTDVLMGSVSMPLTEAVAMTGKWVFGYSVCQFAGVITPIFALTSIFNLTVMAISRYFKIVKSNLYRKWFKPRFILISIGLTWLSALLVSIPYWMQEQIFHPGKQVCIFDLDIVNKIFALVGPLTFICVPITVIAVCYYKIFRSVTTHNVQMAKNKSRGPGNRGITVEEVKITKTILLIIIGFSICWTPFLIIDICGIFKGQYSFPRPVYVLYTYMAGLSSAINPIIYGLMNRDFRNEFAKVLCLKRLHGIRIAVPSTGNDATRNRVVSCQKM